MTRSTDDSGPSDTLAAIVRGESPPKPTDSGGAAPLSDDDIHIMDIRYSDAVSWDDAKRLLTEVYRLRARERRLVDATAMYSKRLQEMNVTNTKLTDQLRAEIAALRQRNENSSIDASRHEQSAVDLSMELSDARAEIARLKESGTK